MKRKLDLKGLGIQFTIRDRLSFAFYGLLSSWENIFTLVKPETVLKWYKKYIKHQLTYYRKRPCGRPPLSKEIKLLILKLKNENLLWGNRRISDELKKLDIAVSPEKVRNVISDFRKKGKVNKTQTWSQFLQSHWNSLFAMDSFHVYSVLGKQYYVLIILKLKSRKIVQFAVTENPVREFIRQQMILFSEKYLGRKTLIHDRASEFCCIDYSDFDIHEVKTGVKSPDMNAYAERVIGSVKREALDNFIIVSRKQLYNILKEYVGYYNHYRPHQGIGKIPDEISSVNTGKIMKQSVLSGLHHHYYRSA